MFTAPLAYDLHPLSQIAGCQLHPNVTMCVDWTSLWAGVQSRKGEPWLQTWTAGALQGDLLCAALRQAGRCPLGGCSSRAADRCSTD